MEKASTITLALGDASTEILDEALEQALEQAMHAWLAADEVKRVLLVPPDHTRLHSQAGRITSFLWKRLRESVEVDVMPALGTHRPMTESECQLMFGDDIPYEDIIPHRWRDDLVQLGELTADELSELSDGKLNEPMCVELNERVVSGAYDLILSIGQVVPHEVIGFANYTKNICIGAGGADMIHKSHYLGAVCGMESIMGRVDTPVRRAVDRAFERFVKPKANVKFLLTVVEEVNGRAILRGLFAGDDDDCYQRAAALSSEVNMTTVDQPLERAVVYLDPQEFSSTWLGNKAIYRTRMAMADDGELIVLAPAIREFGEDPTIDKLIRRYGYCGTPATLEAVKNDGELRNNLSAAAHLIHGSTEGRFRVTYCVPESMSRTEIESAGFEYRDYDSAASEFLGPDTVDGWQSTKDGKPFFFIRNPALGLWASSDRFETST